MNEQFELDYQKRLDEHHHKIEELFAQLYGGKENASLHLKDVFSVIDNAHKKEVKH